MRNTLVVFPSVPVTLDPSSEAVILDEKAYEGWCAYAEEWDGPVRFIFREAKEPTRYARRYDSDALPGEVHLASGNGSPQDRSLTDAAIVLAGGDDYLQLGLVEQAKRFDVPVCYAIEYTLKTRLQILRSERKSLPRKLRSLVWHIGTERRRRNAFAQAAGIQANGLAAGTTYGRINGRTMTYFDNRLTHDMLATDEALAAKSARRRAMEKFPIRLAFSGRLEQLKGAHYLLPVARRLIAMDVPFHLDIYGDGSLFNPMHSEVASDSALARHVDLHGAVDFAEQLMPALRENVDLFLCPHVQGDPSCTYIETFGCGVPIVGFANETWEALAGLGPQLGPVVSIGNVQAMSDQVRVFAQHPETLDALGRNARDFAAGHLFRSEFARRVSHLRELAYADR